MSDISLDIQSFINQADHFGLTKQEILILLEELCSIAEKQNAEMDWLNNIIEKIDEDKKNVL